MSDYVFNTLEPKSLFRYFYEISQIPRGSNNEEGIADYLSSFAASHHLECYRDSVNNILIRKKATSGFENKPGYVLQGHMDMVCESNPDIVHDFTKDPLNLYLDGDMIKAKGTTLGGDDGVSLAIMLAILDSKELSHPNLECLFTTGEEISLVGMSEFDGKLLNARRLINIDSTEEGNAVVSCAGGCRSEFEFDLQRKPDARFGFCISVSGFTGGHSGENIGEGRMNANKAMARLLDAVAVESKLRIINIDGGNKDNAIPRNCTSSFTSDQPEHVKEWLDAEWKLILNDCKEFDKGATFTYEELGIVEKSISHEQSADILRSILVLPSGIIEMNQILNMPETSSNLSVIKTTSDRMYVTSLTRSAVDSKLNQVLHTFDAVAAFASAHVYHRGRYPGWALNENSVLQRLYKDTYQEITGKEAKIIAVHAGLECGLMAEKIPDMDMISIGPDLIDIHSPNERLSSSSLIRTYQLVCELIKK